MHNNYNFFIEKIVYIFKFNSKFNFNFFKCIPININEGNLIRIQDKNVSFIFNS